MQHLILLVNSENPLPLMVNAVIFFFVIYCTFTIMVFLLAKQIDRPIEKRQVTGKQLVTEIINSMRSILLFGIGMILPWLLIQNGYAEIAEKASILQILLECVALILWNDLHFYLTHRL